MILEDTMNAERYLNVLEDTLVPRLNVIDRDQDMIFMQDGAPPHYATLVRTFLNNELPGRWLGRRGPYAWPARSCDITPFGDGQKKKCTNDIPQILKSLNSQ